MKNDETKMGKKNIEMQKIDKILANKIQQYVKKIKYHNILY